MEADLSFMSLTIAGIELSLANCAARQRLSPAIISNKFFSAFLTIIGCIKPCSIIDSESSLIDSKLKDFLG